MGSRVCVWSCAWGTPHAHEWHDIAEHATQPQRGVNEVIAITYWIELNYSSGHKIGSRQGFFDCVKNYVIVSDICKTFIKEIRKRNVENIVKSSAKVTMFVDQM